MSDTKTKPLWLSEEERAVLSSVQASVQEQDDYEGSVLRRATHSLAPTLIPPNFPDVTSLLGGGGGGAGVTNGPVWHSILARTRRTLREWRLRNGRADPEPDRGQADMWHMKEQILWHVLSQTPTTARASVEAAADDDNSYYHERAAEQARSQRLIQPHDDKKQQQHSKHNGGLTIDSAAPTSVRNGFQQGGDDVDTSSTATNSGQQPARRRVPMMKRKRIHRDDNDDDNDGSQKNRLNPQEKEALKQQRTERNRIKHERRRRCHRNNTMPLTDSDGSSDEEMQLDDNSKDDDISKDDDNSKDEEMNDIQPDESNRLGPEDGLQNATTSIHRQDVSEETSDDRVATVQEESVSLVDVKPMVALLAKAATTAVTCPLCQQSIPVPVESDMDAVLSHHMSLCGCDDQTQHQRRSTRSRSTRAVPSYAEPTDEEDPSSEQQQHQRVRAASLRSSVKADFTTMGTRTTSRSRASKVSSVLNGHKAESVRTSTKNDHSKAPVDTAVYPAALDDMNEWAYEDRVDDWLEHGLSRMKKMKERDELESVPGAEEYDGGLLVPAWMNDRLFTYQREGLKWMWDLHQQQAGGIIGDEMGLVRC